MTDPVLGLTMLGLIVVAIMMGFPTAFTLMGLGMLFGFVAFYDPSQSWAQNRIFDLMVQRTYGAMTNDTLISVPLFVYMGYIMERATLVDKMFYSVQLAFKKVPASLAVTTLFVCTFWGIASGIVGAVVVLMGVIACRPMLKAGYDIRLASGVITAGGTLGILIPPSVMIIVYAAVSGQSVVKLYAAAMFPGFFLSFLYLVYIIGWAVINPRVAPRLSESEYKVDIPAWITEIGNRYSRNMFIGLTSALFNSKQILDKDSGDGKPVTYWMLIKNFLVAAGPALTTVFVFYGVYWFFVPHQQVEGEVLDVGDFYLYFWPTLIVSLLFTAYYYKKMDAEKFVILKMLTESVMPLGILTIVVLVVILFGITTATESAAVGAAGAVLLAWQAKQLTFQRIKEATFLTAKTTAMVCWLFVGSALFSGVFALHGGQGLIEQWVLKMNLTPLEFMLLSQTIIFLLGWPLEWTEIIVIFVPIFLPMLQHFNVDPILFGTLVAVNLQAAFLSPPVAMSAFYLKGVSPPHVTLNEIFAGMMPYMVIIMVCMILMYIWPGMTLWLPNFLYK
jgi:TRAP-type mannitol/chloroaromatic compound transport system permease large subunit